MLGDTAFPGCDGGGCCCAQVDQGLLLLLLRLSTQTLCLVLRLEHVSPFDERVFLRTHLPILNSPPPDHPYQLTVIPYTTTTNHIHPLLHDVHHTTLPDRNPDLRHVTAPPQCAARWWTSSSRRFYAATLNTGLTGVGFRMAHAARRLPRLWIWPAMLITRGKRVRSGAALDSWLVGRDAVQLVRLAAPEARLDRVGARFAHEGARRGQGVHVRMARRRQRGRSACCCQRSGGRLNVRLFG